MSSFSFMSMRFSAIYCFPSSSVWGVRSRSTSSWYSDLPISAPRAMAMGSPIIPVPGMPTPMAFLRMLALSRAVIFAGREPRASVALAVASATAIGSVQPMAGTTSLLINDIILSREILSCIVVFISYSCLYLSAGSRDISGCPRRRIGCR